jgi:hypothetical protein
MGSTADFDQPTADELGYEPDKINVRAILIFIIVLVIVVLVTCFTLVGVMAYFSKLDSEREQRQPMLFADEAGQYTGPRLQESPTQDMQSMREETTARLNSYGWVDRQAGIAHIPIEKAIEVYARSTQKNAQSADENSAEPQPEPEPDESATDESSDSN